MFETVEYVVVVVVYDDDDYDNDDDDVEWCVFPCQNNQADKPQLIAHKYVFV